MLRLSFSFFTSFGLFFLLLWGTGGEAAPLFGSVNAVLFVLGALFGALSLAFFNYVEGVMKDEVIVNVVLVVVLLMLAVVVGAFGDMAFVQRLVLSEYWVWGAMSVRGACLLSVLVVLLIQAAGFVTANKLRAEISMYGE
jgi:hypothetical protein